MSSGLEGTLSGTDLQTQLEALRQAQQEELARQAQAAAAAGSQAQTEYQQAAAAPPPQLDLASLFVPTLLGNIASTIAQDPSFRERAGQQIQTKQSDLLKARHDNLTALRDVFAQKAEQAKEAGDLEAEEKYRPRIEALSKQLEVLGQRKFLREQSERGHEQDLERQRIEHQNRLSEIEAQANAAAQKAAITKAKPPSAKEREALTSDVSTLKLINDVRRSFKSEFTGPYQGRRGAASQVTGVARRQGEGKFRAFTASLRNQVLKLRSGGQITLGEAARLLEELPTADNPSGTFLDKLDAFESVARDIAETRRESLSELGIDVSGLSNLPGTLSGRPQALEAAAAGNREAFVQFLTDNPELRSDPEMIAAARRLKQMERR